MPKQRQQITNKSSLESRRREVLTQPQFEGSFEQRLDDGQEELSEGSLKDLTLFDKLLNRVNDNSNLFSQESRRSGGPAEPLTEEQLQRGLDLY
jgi:hypothetical protein